MELKGTVRCKHTHTHRLQSAPPPHTDTGKQSRGRYRLDERGYQHLSNSRAGIRAHSRPNALFKYQPGLCKLIIENRAKFRSQFYNIY